MATNPDAQLATMIANLAETTGKTLDQWTKLALKSGESKHGALVKWLKEKHGMTHGYANLVAHTALKSDAGSRTEAGDDLEAASLAGKDALRARYGAIRDAITALGGDIEVTPKKGYVSFRRKTQFATLHPSTKTRVDLGLKLKGVAPTGRLEAAGSWNAMVTHRVRFEEDGGLDDEVRGWLRAAYEGAA